MAGNPPPDQLKAFLAAIRQHESGGNYQAYNAGGGASGGYQYIQSTWTSNANAAGYGAYANEPASSAPPSVQDAVAAYNATQLYKAMGGNWACVAESWYYPACACQPCQNQVPDPGAGNTITVAEYGAQIVKSMGSVGLGSLSNLGSTGAGTAGQTSDTTQPVVSFLGQTLVTKGQAQKIKGVSLMIGGGLVLVVGVAFIAAYGLKRTGALNAVAALPGPAGTAAKVVTSGGRSVGQARTAKRQEAQRQQRREERVSDAEAVAAAKRSGRVGARTFESNVNRPAARPRNAPRPTTSSRGTRLEHDPSF